jgi:hypothetical protein
MLLPGDELGPSWLPADLHGPEAFDSLLLTLISESSEGTIVVVGNAFIIYANGHDALCLTAAHNFEFIKSLQKSNSLQSHPTLPPDFQFRGTQYIKADGSAAMWTSHGRPYICKVMKINYIQNYDAAVFSAHSDELAPEFPSRMALDIRMPKIGDRVAVLAHRLDLKSQSDERGILERNLVFWLGTVTENPTATDRMNQRFSFETTIPIPPGLSGAPIIAQPELGKTVAVCGVVSFDFSPAEAFTNFQIAGKSRAAAIWPSAGLGFEMNIESKGLSAALIGDLIAENFIDVRSPHVQLSVHPHEGKLVIQYNDIQPIHRSELF